MTFEMLVLEEGERTYDSKKGRQTEYVISVRDAGQGERCVDNFSYALSDEEKDKFKGKLRDNRVRIAVKRLRPQFSGDLRIEGRVEAVPGAK